MSRLFARVNLAGFACVVLVTLAVEAAVRLFALQDSVAAPSATLRALVHEMSSGTLATALGTTLNVYAQGLAVAVALGVVLGVAIGASRMLLDATSVVVEFVRPIPAVALIPAAILLFGLGTPMQRFVIAFGAVWPILVNTIYGVRGADRLLHDVARTSGLTPLGRLVRVTVPAALPSIATGIRVSASLALLVCVTAEFVTGTSGVGAYMHQQQNAFRLPEMYAAVVLTGTLGYAIGVVLRATQRRFVFWTGEDRIGSA